MSGTHPAGEGRTEPTGVADPAAAGSAPPHDTDDADGSPGPRSAKSDPKRARAAAEEASEDFLRDAHPEEDSEDAYGPVGHPLKRHSPFYIGFVGAVGAMLAIWLGQQIQSIGSVLVLIVVAMFLAVGLNPAVEFFMRRGLRRSWAVLVVIVMVVGAVALFFVAIVPVITEQVTTIVDRAPDWFDQLQNNPTIRNLNERYDPFQRAQQFVQGGSFGETVFGGVVGVGMAVLSAVTNTFIVVVLMLYFLASLPGIKRTAYRLAPASRRERVTYLGDEILSNVGGYVSGAFIVAMCAGVTSLVFLLLVGLAEYAVALAAVVTLLDVIPMIGATLGAVVVSAIGFATDPKIGLACLIFYVLYQQFENYVVYPRVMARSVDIPGSLIVIAALVGAALLGVVGALLAIPTAAALLLLLKEVFLRRQDAR
jgi:predicted PurR-regulated permease PerM